MAQQRHNISSICLDARTAGNGGILATASREAVAHHAVVGVVAFLESLIVVASSPAPTTSAMDCRCGCCDAFLRTCY